ncbi:MAG: type II secretion system protein [Rickettsiales bacterium]|nr:type II secretion system protein [Rickettsiales bacterium]
MKIFKKIKGFSLIETIVTIVTVGAVATASFIGVSTKDQISAHKQASEELSIIRNSIIEFSKSGRYPCPASPINAQGFGSEAIDTDSGYCKTSNLLSYDLDKKSEYQGAPVPVEADFVMGIVPFSSLGLSEEVAKDGKGNFYGYAVTNHKTKRGGCSSFASSDGSAQYAPTKFGVLTNYDINKSFLENLSLYADSNENAEFYVIYYGQDAVGSWSKNGVRNIPNKASISKNDSISSKSVSGFIGYDAASEVNADFGKQEQFDNFILAPSQSLNTPQESLDKYNIQRSSSFDDIVVYGKSNYITNKICVGCRACDATYANIFVQVDSFNSCNQIADLCKCTNASQCDGTLGECCNSQIGQCGKQFCAANCSNNSECPVGECCQITNGNGTCSALFCADNPRCVDKQDCGNSECCSLEKQECSLAFCADFPNCCEADSCCDARCTNHDAKICDCNKDSCSSKDCPNYDLCTCEPDNPKCKTCNDNSECQNNEICIDSKCVNNPDFCSSNSDCENGKCCFGNICSKCIADENSSSSSGSSSSSSGAENEGSTSSSNGGDASSSSSSSSSSGGEPACCSTNSCCDNNCFQYDLCLCSPNTSSCNDVNCNVDADCGNGKCCINKQCVNCGNETDQPCEKPSDCDSSRTCCNGMCVNSSALVGGNCADAPCDPISNPCALGFVCCSGICEEARINIFGKVDGIAGTIAKGGGNIIIRGLSEQPNSSSSGSGEGDSSGQLGNSGQGGGSSGLSTISISLNPQDLCNTCQSSLDCNGGNCCNGICSQAACNSFCSNNLDCEDPATPFCCGNYCQAAPCSCTNNSQCPSGTPNCCNGTCQVAPCSCTNNSQCPSGMSCCNGACQVGSCSCTNNSQCSASKPYCCNGTCQSQNCCTNNSQCPNGQCCNVNNGQCSASNCVPSCCSTDSCCSQNCPAYDEFQCACQQDQCISSFCPQYNFCLCNPGSCNGSSSSGSSSSSSSGGNGCDAPNYQCNSYSLNTYNCGSQGCCAQTGSIQWSNAPNPCSNTIDPNFNFQTNIPPGHVITSGNIDGLNWEFRFGGMVISECPNCKIQPMCAFVITNTCNVITQNNTDDGSYTFPITCKLGVDYSQATILETNINTANQGSEHCSFAFKWKRTTNENSFWASASTTQCGSSGCGQLDGFCRNSFQTFPMYPLMCTNSP